MKYTGIGSRATPIDIQRQMTDYAKRLSLFGYVLRSGGAEGADTAFEIGAVRKEIYLPWKNFNDNDSQHYDVDDRALEIAKDIHPNWNACSEGARKLHGRNVYQVLGKDLNSPSEFVVFWAEEEAGEVRGGTRTAVELAKQHDIPTYNLFNLKEHQKFNRLMLRLYVIYIRTKLRFYSLFYSDSIEADDLNIIDALVQIEVDKYTKVQLRMINRLFTKYKGIEKDENNHEDIDNLRM